MTLTDLSYYVRKYYPYGILGVLIFLVIFYAVQLTILVVESGKKPVVQINPIFNQIKKPYLSEASPSAGFTFTLDTVEGKPITASQSAKVFFLPPPETKFGYREKIYLIAKTLGFDTEVSTYRLLGSQAVFSDSKQKLTIDIKNFNFTYQYFFENEPGLLSDAIAPTQQESQAKATQFLETVGRYPPELTQGKNHMIFLRYNSGNNSMTFLDDNIGANLVEVDLYRPDIDTYPIVSPKYFNSQNYVLLAFSPGGRYKILRAQVKFFEKSVEQVGTYPLRTGDEAYAMLQKGKGSVVSNPKGLKNVIIRKMFLGYFDPDIYQEYLQPVYVFLGDGDFIAYVSAVNDQYLIE